MAEPVKAAPAAGHHQLKRFSCLTCRQRKVKCDRRDPCSNCVKAARECSFVPPVRGKRRRTKPAKEGLHARVRRYEEMLKSFGAKLDPAEMGSYGGSGGLGAESDEEEDEDDDDEDGTGDDHGDGASVSQAGPDAGNRPPSPRAYPTREPLHTRLINGKDSTRYVDSSPWSNVVNNKDFPEYPKESAIEGDPDLSSNADSDFLLGSGRALEGVTNEPVGNLASLHPPYHILLKLWETYADRVDPMMKVLHLPTFWISLTDAIQRPQNVSKSLGALICAFYLITVHSLDEDECQAIMEEPKKVVFNRYCRATRRALKAAKLLRTTSAMTLRAYFIFLMGARTNYTTDTFYILSGVAVRLAWKMGIHRDGTALGLSPFETEMRRRLWWPILLMDGRTSGLMGVNPSMDLFSGDAKRPLNILDEDLIPDMVSFPPEIKNITPVSVALLRCEMADFLRKFNPDIAGSSLGGRKDINGTLSSAEVNLANRENIIDQLNDTLESKFLRYCDPTNSLDHFFSIMARSSICVCRIKIGSHNIRQGTDRGIDVPQKDRDTVFAAATKMLEYLRLMRQSGTMDKYMWQAGTSVLWNSLLWTLIEIRHRKVGPAVARAWGLIGSLLAYHKEMFQRSTTAVFAVLGKWLLEAWDTCLAANAAAGIPEQPTPEWLNTLRSARAPRVKADVKMNDAVDSQPVVGIQPWDGYEKTPVSHVEDDVDQYIFSNLLDFEMAPAQWAQWESLLSADEVSGF